MFVLMDLKGETTGVKRRDGHYRDSCEGHIHVRLPEGGIGEQAGVKELPREETLRGVAQWRGGRVGVGGA